MAIDRYLVLCSRLLIRNMVIIDDQLESCLAHQIADSYIPVWLYQPRCHSMQGHQTNGRRAIGHYRLVPHGPTSGQLSVWLKVCEQGVHKTWQSTGG
jgi:hypothetical protein